MKSVHEVTSEQTDYDSDCYDDDTLDSFFVHTVGLNSSSQPDQVFVKVSVGTSNSCSELDCKIDTGSQINCLPISMYKSLKLDFPPGTVQCYLNCIFWRPIIGAWESCT